MRIRLTNHAQARLLERGVEPTDIRTAMTSPDKRVPAQGGKMEVHKKIGKKTLVVIYSKEQFRDKKEEYSVVTAYYI